MSFCYHYSCTRKQKMELFLKKLLYISEPTKRYDLFLKREKNQVLVSSLFMTLDCHSLYAQVAIICNHQRSVSKSHESQMTRLNEKIDDLKVGFLPQVINSCFCHRKSFHTFFLLQAQRDELKADLSKAKKGKPLGKDKDGKTKKNLAPEA